MQTFFWAQMAATKKKNPDIDAILAAFGPENLEKWTQNGPKENQIEAPTWEDL